jgi:toxin ParE1/3/4
MSRRVRTTARAEKDIQSIGSWIARESMPAAMKWLEDLDARFSELAEAPGSGTDRNELRPGMRSSPFGNYLIFFKRLRDGIQVVRVIHGARDYKRLFKR